MTKSELRKLFLEKRNALSPEEVAEMSRRIADRFFTSFDLSDLNSVHCFISIPKFNEIDTSIIFERLWLDFPQIRTFAPRLDRVADQMEQLAYTPRTTLNENFWGIREPAGEERVDPEDVDLVLVPLLCFDRRGYRVGYGKGYYDGFLSECRPECLKIGLSYFGPVDEISDVHEGDVALDYSITPDDLFRFAGERTGLTDQVSLPASSPLKQP